MTEIPRDYILAGMILEDNQKHEPVWFSKLVFRTGWGTKEVSYHLDKLLAYGVVTYDREYVYENFVGWTFCYYVKDEYKLLIRKLLNS